MNAKESAATFDFSDRGCLYIDHLGHRVLTDLEGAGEFRIVRQETDCDIRVDDILHTSDAGPFRESLLITAPKPGAVQIDVRLGPVPTLPEPTTKTDHYQGAGYILSATQIEEVDHDHQPRGRIGYPIPFFQEARGKDLEIAPTKAALTELDSFNIDDEPALKQRGWTVQNISKISTLSSTFPDGTAHQAAVASHLNAASWKIEIPKNSGLILRRLYDAFHGRQRARVLINNQFQGWWYEPTQDRTQRWRWSQFGTDEAPEGQVTITIDPPAGSPLWSVSRMEVWALLD